jgi:sulfite exporter TauE/SafE/copper chaperone CopZ
MCFVSFIKSIYPMKKLIVPIAGMHCRSCEILIENKLSKIPEIKKCHSNYKKGIVEIFYDVKPSRKSVEDALREVGYAIGVVGKKPLFTKNASDYKDLGIALLFVIGLYFILKEFGISDLINVGNASKPTSLSVSLLVGLTAGFSTCLALVGGLILGISARHSEKHPEATPAQKFRPHLYFNIGRIISYAVLGGALGSLGSFLQLSGSALGIIMIAVGLVMFLLGVKLMGISPRLENVNIVFPKKISRLLGVKNDEREYSHKNAFALGAMTFFLPCGFTQAMQIYAVSTGSFAQGSLIMGLFALGTAPGLLGIGGLTSVIKGVFAQRFFKFSGIVVAGLALFNINNGLNLTNWDLKIGTATETNGAAVQSVDPNVKIENGVQVVRMTESARGYTPNKFTIRQGIPVKWIIDGEEPFSCASSLVSSKIGVRKNLSLGQNIIEFTPMEIGQIPFSCSMGMYRGAFSVIASD